MVENKTQEQLESNTSKLLKYLEKTRPGAWFWDEWEIHPVRLVGLLLLGGAAISFLLNFMPGKLFEDYSANVATEMASVALTVLVIDALHQRRQDEQLKKQLILQMGSKHNDVTFAAIRTMKSFGWGFDRDKTLQEARLVNANLQEARLSGANLQRTILDRTNLQRASLEKANLQGASLDKASLQGASMNEANLQGAHLYKANFQGANLNRAILKEANLDEADLQGASLYKANLQEASINEAYLQGAGLGGADLQGAKLNRADLRGARLGTADLRKAHLGEAHLQDSHLYRANLQEAVLYGADLRGAHLNEANLKGAILFGADLRGAKGLSLQHLKSVKTLSGTTMPDGSSPEELALRLYEEGRIDEATFNTLIHLAGVGA